MKPVILKRARKMVDEAKGDQNPKALHEAVDGQVQGQKNALIELQKLEEWRTNYYMKNIRKDIGGLDEMGDQQVEQKEKTLIKVRELQEWLTKDLIHREKLEAKRFRKWLKNDYIKRIRKNIEGLLKDSKVLHMCSTEAFVVIDSTL